jgi:AraC-like DNA-binding protein
MGFFLIVLVSFLGWALFGKFYVFDYVSKYWIAQVSSLFILVSSLLLVIRPSLLLKKVESGKYQNSGLTEDMLLTLKGELVHSLETQKVYLNNNLTLELLAQKMNTDRYSLSQVINQEFGKNFYELINDYRIRETLAIIERKPQINSINDLIYESGFNNKVSFYNAFKKRKKMTPLQYIHSRGAIPKKRKITKNIKKP